MSYWRCFKPRLVCIALVIIAAVPCWAQVLRDWSFTAHWKGDNFENFVNGVGSGVIAGSSGYDADSFRRPTIWNGPGNDWVDLMPPGAFEGSVFGAGGDQQVGFARFNDSDHAALWRGSAHSFVDLGPGLVADTDGEVQVGGPGIAVLWRGTRESRVILHPEGATESFALAVDSGVQAGYSRIGGRHHAGLWRGSAESWVDLNPIGTGSEARSVARGQQAGWVDVGGNKHASIWHGTADSWIDLNPSGSARSEIVGTTGELQVGGADGWGYVLWHGTNQPIFKLRDALPPRYGGMIPTSIEQEGNRLYIGGSAYNTDAQRIEGIVLTAEIVPEPATLLALAPAMLVLMRRRLSAQAPQPGRK